MKAKLVKESLNVAHINKDVISKFRKIEENDKINHDGLLVEYSEDDGIVMLSLDWQAFDNVNTEVMGYDLESQKIKLVFRNNIDWTDGEMESLDLGDYDKDSYDPGEISAIDNEGNPKNVKRYHSDVLVLDAAMLVRKDILIQVLDRIMEKAYERVEELKESFEDFYGYPWGEDAPEDDEEDVTEDDEEEKFRKNSFWLFSKYADKYGFQKIIKSNSMNVSVESGAFIHLNPSSGNIMFIVSEPVIEGKIKKMALQEWMYPVKIDNSSYENHLDYAFATLKKNYK